MTTPYYTMDPNTGFPAGFPVPTQSPSNQMAFYQNSISQYPQSKTPQQLGQQQHPVGVMPMQPGGPGGAMMPSGFSQQSSAPMDAYSAPFVQPPVPASISQFSQSGTAQNQPSTVQQTFNQNMASLNANMLATQPRPSQMNPHSNPQVNPQMNPQMNAPMNPQLNSQMSSPQTNQPGTPAQPHNQAQSQAQAQVQAQIQAQTAAREKARVTLLLEINSTLLQEVVNLQAAGKAGTAPNTDSNADSGSDAPKPPPQKPSPEYIECMRRLQANLSYLAAIAERAKKPGNQAPQAPAILTPPSSLPAVNDLYSKLNELFPRPSQSGTPQKLSPGAQNSGGPSPSSVSESVA